MKKKRCERLVVVDELGYPRWMDLPLKFWADDDLHDWLWENGMI